MSSTETPEPDGTDWQAIIDSIGAIASAFVTPGATLAGFTIDQILALLKGLALGIPDILAAWKNIQDAVDGGDAPTPAQLLALKQAVDQNDDAIQAAVAAQNAAEDED